jgi:hypothetical protein
MASHAVLRYAKFPLSALLSRSQRVSRTAGMGQLLPNDDPAMIGWNAPKAAILTTLIKPAAREADSRSENRASGSDDQMPPPPAGRINDRLRRKWPSSLAI